MQTGETEEKAKKTIIAPIVVTEHESDVYSLLKEKQIECNIKLNSVGRKIFVNSVEDKKKIIEIFKEKKMNFYSHPENNTKSFKVILSGLPQIDTTLIVEGLKEHKIAPTNVIMFNTKSVSKLYLLHFDAESVNKQMLNEIKYLYHHVITWLPFKAKRKGPTQCMRCLMYGHGISSCSRYTVCMLCAGTHLTKECTTHNGNTNTDFKCFNCLSANIQHNHKANDVNCPFRMEYEQARSNARNRTSNYKNAQSDTHRQQTHTKTTRPPPTPTSQKSYADAARGATASSSRTQSNPRTTTHNQSQARSTPNDNFDAGPSSNLWSFEECANLLFDSIEKLQKCKTKLDQLKVIANLLQHACE